MKCRVVKGGWSWLGITRNVGDVLDAPSPEWIQNRINDGGLVEAVESVEVVEAPAPIETAAIVPAENAALPSQRGSAKQRK